MVKYHIIQNKKNLKKLKGLIERTEEFSFDFETTGLNTINDKIVGLSIAPKEKLAFYLPFNHKQNSLAGNKNLDLEETNLFLRDIFESDYQKVAHNTKFDLAFLRKLDLEPGLIHDTMIMSRLINYDQSAGLKTLASSKLGLKTKSFKETTEGKNAQETTIQQLYKYACKDSDWTLRLFHKFQDQIEEKNLERVLKLETLLIPILQRMERTGVRLDKDLLEDEAEKLKDKTDSLKQKIQNKLDSKDLNPNSPDQLLKALNQDGLDIKSTERQVLKDNKDKHESIPLILTYRDKFKIYSSFLKALPNKINKKTEKIHPEFKQVVRTGRFSCKDPNFQQLPKGKAGDVVRKSILPLEEDHKIVAPDYSQVELRVLAHFSQDPEMIQAFEEDQDIHQKTADLIGESRKKAKGVNFGIVYGTTAHGLSKRLDIEKEKAENLIESYFNTYQGVKDWIDQKKQEARDKGLVRTLSNRIRYLEDVNSDQDWKRERAERKAVNTVIQGSGADILKMAMLKVSHNSKFQDSGAKMILNVHDELVFSIPEDEIKSTSKEIKQDMESAWDLKVPLKVDVEVGDNYGEMEEIELD